MSDAQLMSRVDDFIDRDKRALGGGGTHGLSHRFREQIHGANGPGTPSWQNHEDQITGQQSGLRKCIAEYDRRVAAGTAMPPLRPDARPWSTKPPPAASDWVGPTPPPPPPPTGGGGS
ncbi:hypothetical protein [Sorangium sp. So ce1099]|uniref:hypothetical protein n=1 Tax=Sorangium sp. So ce1099 TaxID=3133331 RepID=UPI003F600642